VQARTHTYKELITLEKHGPAAFHRHRRHPKDDAADPTFADAGDIDHSLPFRMVRTLFIHDKQFPSD
jgi:hypothetical protein